MSYGIAKAIKDYIPKYQEQLKQMKKNNDSIIGYCRKSCTSEDDEARVRLLQSMANKLKARSLVDRVYVSPYSMANGKIRSRDFSRDYDLSGMEDITGTTQDMISYISITPNVSHVVLDFAGLTTDVNDLKQFLL
ncbi:hypothetical protein DFQ28_003203 [Apophysomyces sp. BC1034]|nr:hypothetical protein DFQ30_000052 [Apophysomyces sp. BC1015]KAG0183431.1 hypothetical protein DFQ29_004375 [Apophysomyces sp. BC1021]KAG0193799.1 hypothetical protein DFQ28_003203 [Apophysomyces sp. BC1034]